MSVRNCLNCPFCSRGVTFSDTGLPSGVEFRCSHPDASVTVNAGIILNPERTGCPHHPLKPIADNEAVHVMTEVMSNVLNLLDMRMYEYTEVLRLFAEILRHCRHEVVEDEFLEDIARRCLEIKKQTMQNPRYLNLPGAMQKAVAKWPCEGFYEFLTSFVGTRD